jgi:hypothetical protein
VRSRVSVFINAFLKLVSVEASSVRVFNLTIMYACVRV